eukprot:gb/GFBE01081865.1/.p1 GENE.gb/GFBE01081865.1/~~gb/GFBE01081865.1/.p1  ORF type:complete len:122 (+),score=14.92 gb/GFBE01081865.1/:1-366(+)
MAKGCAECGHSGIFYELGLSMFEDQKGRARCAACIEEHWEAEEPHSPDSSDEGYAGPGGLSAWAVASALGPRSNWPGCGTKSGGESEVQNSAEPEASDEHPSATMEIESGPAAKRLRTGSD